jgi:multidrug resistance protein, MATE family
VGVTEASGIETEMPGHRAVLAIALPMMLAYLSTALVGVVSTAAVGRLADPELSAGIAIAAILFDLLLTSLSFLRSATLGLVAQAMGRRDAAEIRAVQLRALVLAMLLGLVIVALSGPETRFGLPLLGAHGRVFAAARDYTLIRILSAPMALGNYAILGVLLGRGRASWGLALQILLNGTNMAVCAWTVLVLGWGVRGAAVAAFAGETVAFAAGLLLLWRMGGLFSAGGQAALSNRDGWRRMGVLNRDILIRTLALLFAFAFFTRQSAAFGAVVLAANAIHMQFFALAANCLDGFAAAAEQLAGVMIGAHDRLGFRRAVRLTFGWSLASGLALTLAYFAIARPFVALLTGAPLVREAAMRSLGWAALMPLAGAVAFQMDGIFIGASWSRDMRDMMLLSLAIFLLCWAVLAPLLGNSGLWIAFLVFLAIRGCTLGWRLRIRLRS